MGMMADVLCAKEDTESKSIQKVSRGQKASHRSHVKIAVFL